MDETGAGEQTALAGRYALGSLLGQGGMGAVRDATDLRLGRRVAVKILRSDLAEQPTARRRFETEAKAAARLAHPNVVLVFDSGEDEGVPFLVMERLPGRTLADELADGPLSLERVRAVAREILDALSAAHAAGVIHRDIKPGNVLLTDDGHVKVSDFGIAKTVDDADQTQTLELVATPGYLAPERLAGEPATERTDLYAVGVLLYEALSGRRPFEGDSPLMVMRAIEHGRPQPLTSPKSELPDAVVAVIERAMSRDPAVRFASAAEMAAALDAAETAETAEPAEPPAPPAAGWESQTVPIDRTPRGGETQTLHLPHPPPGPSRRVLSRTNRRAVLFGIGLVLAVLLVVGVVAARRSPARPAGSVPVSGAPSTSATAKLPAALDDALRRLEQEVAK